MIRPKRLLKASLLNVKAKVDDGTYDSQFCCTAMKARGSTKLYDTTMEDLDRIDKLEIICLIVYLRILKILIPTSL